MSSQRLIILRGCMASGSELLVEEVMREIDEAFGKIE